MSAKAGRDGTLDCAKGLAMIAVVISHAMRGAAGDGLFAATAAFRIADDALYLWHVQLFLLISGYLAQPRARDGHALARREISLGYAYFLWSAISLSGLLLSHRPTGASTVLGAWLSLFYAPIQHFWFLAILMIGYGVLYIANSARGLIIAIATCLLFRPLFAFSYYGIDYYLLFFLCGALLRLHPVTPPRPALMLGGAVLIFASGVTVSAGLPVEPPTYPILVPFSLAGCYVAYRLARTTTRWPGMGSVLQYVGANSLPIYLAHVLFTAGSREMVERIAPDAAPAIVLIVSILIGTAGPLILHRLAALLGLASLLGFEPLMKPPRRDQMPSADLTSGPPHPAS